MLAAIATQVYGLGKTILTTCCFFRIVSLSFMLFCCWDCFFAKDSMYLSFCHIWAGIRLQRVAFTYSILTRMIFSTCFMDILLLVLIFSCIDFRNSTVRIVYSMMFACWVSMEGQFVVMIAQLVSVAN